MSDKKKSTIILILMLLSFFVLTFLIITFFYIKYNNNDLQTQNIISNNIDVSIVSEPTTIEDILKEHDAEFISQDVSTIYATFGEDLYNEDGNSNESYFIDLIEDLKQFFEKTSFELKDEEKDIDISVKYDPLSEDYEIVYNNIENFYKQTNGDDYVNVETTSIIDASVIFMHNGYLEKLILNNMYFSSIEEYLTESKELDDGYISYPEQKLKVKLAPNKTVQNIIFFDEYEGKILSDVTLGMSLSEILELHPDNSSGSLEDGYLGYRNGDLYYFFYPDEVSIYGYSYSKNENFEKLLKAYLEDKDLDKFVKGLQNKLKVYDEFEYDSEIKKLYMTFPTRGIEIDIEDNDSKGITLYSNYYFTEYTKKMVKDGLITLNSKEDLVLKYESARRANN